MVLSPPASRLASAVLSRLSLRRVEDDPVITKTADRAVAAGLMTERDWVSDHGVHYVITSVLHLRQQAGAELRDITERTARQLFDVINRGRSRYDLSDDLWRSKSPRSPER